MPLTFPAPGEYAFPCCSVFFLLLVRLFGCPQSAPHSRPFSSLLCSHCFFLSSALTIFSIIVCLELIDSDGFICCIKTIHIQKIEVWWKYDGNNDVWQSTGIRRHSNIQVFNFHDLLFLLFPLIDHNNIWCR